MPDVLQVTASTEDGVVMAIEHKTLPIAGVQFHPESLMSLGGEVGLRIVENAFRLGVPPDEQDEQDLRETRWRANTI
jgi:anthranilate synthase